MPHQIHWWRWSKAAIDGYSPTPCPTYAQSEEWEWGVGVGVGLAIDKCVRKRMKSICKATSHNVKNPIL